MAKARKAQLAAKVSERRDLRDHKVLKDLRGAKAAEAKVHRGRRVHRE